jgi:hypothetical protein
MAGPNFELDPGRSRREGDGAKSTDITGELFTYRPLSQLIPTLVLPAIDVKVANGAILPPLFP